jgi:hypothetical protein
MTATSRTVFRRGSKIYRMRISLRPAEPGRSSFRLLSREWRTRSASGRPSSGPASSSMPMAWPTWIALGRSRLRKSCSAVVTLQDDRFDDDHLVPDDRGSCKPHRSSQK